MNKENQKNKDFRTFKLSKEELAFEKGLISQKTYEKYLRKILEKTC